MVYSADSTLAAPITVLYNECRGQVSLRQLARDLGATRTSLRRAKNWLIENRHPTFENYVPDAPLSPEQAEAIIRYRSYTTTGIKGDALTEKMFPDIETTNTKKNALRDLFEQHNIPPEQAAQLTYSILEIFHP